MARLETQIKQIFLTHPKNLESSQIFHDEAVTESTHLFLIGEINKMKRILLHGSPHENFFF